MDIKREVLKLAEQLIEPAGEPLDERLFKEFRREFGFELHDDLKEWLRLYNGGVTKNQHYYLSGLCEDTEWDLREYLRHWSKPSRDWEIPNFKRLRWAPFAANDEGDIYWLQCQPDRHRLTPVYYLNHEEVSHCIVASDLWHFLWLMLQGEAAGKNYYWMFDREYVLKHDPRLKVYEGKELLAWEYYGPEGFGSAED